MSGKDTQAPEKTPPTLSLRLAEASDDLDLLRPLIAEFHQASHFSGVPLSQAKIEAMFAEAVARPDRYAVIIAEYDRRAFGFLYCFAGEYVGIGCLRSYPLFLKYYTDVKLKKERKKA